MYVVEHYWHAVTRSFGEPYIARYDSFEYLGSEETTEICGNLLGQGGAIVVHREQNTFDGKIWIDCSAKTHQRVEELGDSLECQIFALNRNHHGIASGQRVYG
jgi:hypothetical protein